MISLDCLEFCFGGYWLWLILFFFTVVFGFNTLVLSLVLCIFFFPNVSSGEVKKPRAGMKKAEIQLCQLANLTSFFFLNTAPLLLLLKGIWVTELLQPKLNLSLKVERILLLHNAHTHTHTLIREILFGCKSITELSRKNAKPHKNTLITLKKTKNTPLH